MFSSFLKIGKFRYNLETGTLAVKIDLDSPSTKVQAKNKVSPTSSNCGKLEARSGLVLEITIGVPV